MGHLYINCIGIYCTVECYGSSLHKQYWDLKSVMGHLWAAEYCPQAEFYAKIGKTYIITFVPNGAVEAVDF